MIFINTEEKREEEFSKKEVEDNADEGSGVRYTKEKFLFLVMSFLLLIVVFYRVGFEGVLFRIGTLDIYTIFGLVGLTALVFFIDAFRWKIVIDGLKRSSYTSLFPIFLGGNFVNTITPGLNSGGEVVRAYYLSKLTGKTKAECFATIIIDGFALGLAFFVLLLFSLVYMSLFLKVTRKVVVLVAIVFAFLFSAGGLYYRHRKRAKTEKFREGFSRFLRKIYQARFLKRFFKEHRTFEKFENFTYERIEHFKSTFKNLVKNKSLFLKAFSVSFIPMLLMILRSYILFRAMGEVVDFLTILAVLSCAYFLGYFIPLPGGIGIIEAAMIELYIVNDIDPAVAGAVALLDRSFYLMFSMGGGYLSLNYLAYKYTLKKDEKA
ncbi:MAG TPA: flippase-like domain-containing protein [Thermoplasmata archaeon]|nr:flippase-like domain-containing protein [Thermoplasmata archaeon]